MQCNIVVRDEDILGFLFDYLIDGGPLKRLVQIAGWINNKPIEPGISWHELISAARQLDPRSAAERLLLLLPAVGDADLPDDANRVVAEALSAVGAVRRQEELAANLLHYAGEDEHQWTSVDGTTLSTSEDAARRHGGELTESELSLIKRAFRA